MPKIAFDIDGTVFDFHTMFCKLYNERFHGHRVEVHDIQANELLRTFPITSTELSLLVDLTIANYEHINPFPGAIEQLKNLMKLTGEGILFCTVRQKNLHQLHTMRLLNLWLGYSHELHWKVLFTKEPAVLKQYGVEVFFEDQQNHCASLINSGIKVFVHKRPWNNKMLVSPQNSYELFDSWYNIDWNTILKEDK